MTINEWYSFLKLYGLQGTGLMFFLFIFWQIARTEWFSDKFKKSIGKLIFKDKSKNKSGLAMSSIENHNMFNYIDFWINSRVPTLKFSTEYRTIVFRKYLTILLMKYREHTHQYIASKVYEKMNEDELWKSILNLINTIVYEYEKEMEKMNVPKIIIEKMKERNNETITLIIDLTEGVCSSEFYDSENNLLKIYSIQNILLSVLQNIISNSIIVCNTINGDLKGQYVIVDGKKIIEKEIEH
jgi:hypothetical protein